MSALRNTMYEFLLKNGFIENSIQKGFTLGMSGTFEPLSYTIPWRECSRSKSVRTSADVL